MLLKVLDNSNSSCLFVRDSKHTYDYTSKLIKGVYDSSSFAFQVVEGLLRPFFNNRSDPALSTSLEISGYEQYFLVRRNFVKDKVGVDLQQLLHLTCYGPYRTCRVC